MFFTGNSQQPPRAQKRCSQEEGSTKEFREGALRFDLSVLACLQASNINKGGCDTLSRLRRLWVPHPCGFQGQVSNLSLTIPQLTELTPTPFLPPSFSHH